MRENPHPGLRGGRYIVETMIEIHPRRLSLSYDWFFNVLPIATREYIIGEMENEIAVAVEGAG